MAMERRTKLLILIIIGILILLFGIWYLLQPNFRNVEQPPDVNNGTPTTPIQTTSTPQFPNTGSSAPLPPDVKQLQDLAGIVVSRIGSGSSGEGFQGYNDVLINATMAYRETLRTEQSAMQTAHPSTGPNFGVVTRVIASDPVSAETGAAEMVFRVQAQRAEDAGNPGVVSLVSYKEATVTFQRQADGTYLVSSIVWKDIER